MSYIDYNDIVNIKNLESKRHYWVARRVIDFAILKQKFENPNEQSWYFKKSIEYNRRKFMDLKKEFKEIRKDINESKIDDLFTSIEKEKAELMEHSSNWGIRQRCMFEPGYLFSINYCQELIEIKSRVKEVKDIDFYLDNVDEFINLLGW